MICYLGKCRLILTLKTTTTTKKKTSSRDFAGGPVVRTLRSHCQGSGFNPWSGNYNNPTAMRPKNKTNTLQPRVFSLKHSLFFCLLPDCWKPPVLPVHEPSHRRPRRLWYHWHDSRRSDQFRPEEKLGISGQGPAACSLQQALRRRKRAPLLYEQLFIRDVSGVQVKGVIAFGEACKVVDESNVYSVPRAEVGGEGRNPRGLLAFLFFLF